MCILLVVVILLCGGIYSFFTHYTIAPDLCDTKECLRSAAALRHNMDPSADPCDEFYRYACGKWADENPRPQQQSSHNWFGLRQDKVYGIIRDRLMSNATDDDPLPVQKAKAMYMGCLSSDHRKKEGYKAVEKLLKKVGLPLLPKLVDGTPLPKNYKFDWISSIARVKRILGLNVIIGFDIVNDFQANGVKRMILSFPIEARNSIFPSYEWSKKQSEVVRIERELSSKHSDHEATGNRQDETQQVQTSLTALIELLYPNITISNIEKNITMHAGDYVKIVNIFKKVPKDEDEDSIYQFKVEQLQNMTDSNLDKPFPVWKPYLDTLFENLSTARPTGDDELQSTDRHLDSLSYIIEAVSKQPPALIELYVWVHVTAFIVTHKFNQYKDLDEDACAKHVLHLMGLAVSYAIADPDFLTETKPQLDQMVDNIGIAFRQMMKEADWMDAETKRASIEKSQAMKTLIGFPEWIMDVQKLTDHYGALEIDAERHVQNWINAVEFLNYRWLASWRQNVSNIWDMNPTEVNAFFLHHRNAINIPIAIIQYPFYYLGLEALNYGAIGEILGHEMTHGFDDSGINFDKSGNFAQWWSNETINEYHKRAQCLVEQYSKFYLKEAKQFVNGTLTLGENIADNGGLREAFRAYREYVKINGTEPLLPGMEDFTHEQLFFLSFANQNCASVWSIGAQELLEDEHSPNEFRVRGVLQNMEEFSTAFKCPKGSAMNPERKCRVW
ncbi:neprilysin-like [Uranotaenia lowii]|uniref:neprilysin-like n=1 Tax=Uranotaenia lowii TaxID=190385 RepID=UPI002479ECC9|nr:neprilysin-like [Uranotaenia lowii]